MSLRRLLGFLFFTGALGLACAENAPSAPSRDDGVSPSPGGGLFETAGDAKLRKDAWTAAEVGKSIEALGGVVRARVHLTTPSHSLLTANNPAKSGAAVVVVRDNHQRPTVAEIRALVAAAVPSISGESVRVFMSTSPRPVPEMTWVGPIEVSVASALMARVIIGLLLGLSIVASAGLIVAGIKLRSMRRQL